MPSIGIKISVDSSVSNRWIPFWQSLISATVEDANPNKIVLTFSKADTSLVASYFSVSGITATISSISRDAREPG